MLCHAAPRQRVNVTRTTMRRGDQLGSRFDRHYSQRRFTNQVAVVTGAFSKTLSFHLIVLKELLGGSVKQLVLH